jgi:hypothetical protein
MTVSEQKWAGRDQPWDEDGRSAAGVSTFVCPCRAARGRKPREPLAFP